MDINNMPTLTGSKVNGEIVSVTAYLLGIARHRFDEPSHELDPEIFEKLEQNKQAKIFRSLSIIRTKTELNHQRVIQEILTNKKTTTSVPDLIPKEEIDFLYSEGIDLYKVNSRTDTFLIAINKEIINRIHIIRNLYPAWIKWDYIKDIFIMPKGTNKAGLKSAAAQYYKKKEFCPYKAYMNYLGEEHEGNILTNDIHFLNVIYKWHGDTFKSFSKVQDADIATKNGITDFIQQSQNTIAVVDCENASPYAFYAMIKGLRGQKIDKINKIFLVNDERASSAWQIFEDFTDISVEQLVPQRIKNNKSLTDMTVATKICKEFYQGKADRFLLISSDSDYWPLIDSLPDAEFLVVLEHDKRSPQFVEILEENGVLYCYSDIFNSNDSDLLKRVAMIKEIRTMLPDVSKINLYNLLDQADRNTYACMDEIEKENFYKQVLSKIHFSIAEDGQLMIDF